MSWRWIKWLLKPPYPFLLDFQVIVLLLYIIILLALYLAPLTFTCPCIMDRHSLKPRPDIIGRRGAPMVSWCFSRPHCLILLIVQMDDVPLCGKNSLPRPVRRPFLLWIKVSKKNTAKWITFLLRFVRIFFMFVDIKYTCLWALFQCMSLQLSGSVSMKANNTLNCHFTAGQANTVPDD